MKSFATDAQNVIYRIFKLGRRVSNLMRHRDRWNKVGEVYQNNVGRTFCDRDEGQR